MYTEVKNHTEAELRAEAGRLVEGLQKGKGARVIALFGDLGAGKTTFTKALAEVFGVEELVTSPTFVIQKRYPLKESEFEMFIHIDAYRLDDESDLLKLNWEGDVSNPNNVIVIEWADKVEKLLPKDAMRINLAFLDEHTRSFSYGNN